MAEDVKPKRSPAAEKLCRSATAPKASSWRREKRESGIRGLSSTSQGADGCLAGPPWASRYRNVPSACAATCPRASVTLASQKHNDLPPPVARAVATSQPDAAVMKVT